jgi:H+/Cl- antiporter ClcA
MVQDFVQTVGKLTIASLIVGTAMSHFGVTAEKLVGAFGLTPERALELAQQGMTWALPNLTLGALVIVPVWFVVYLFRPPRARSD